MRHLPWDDVADLRVDPPGGARAVRLTLRTGSKVTLPALARDADTRAVVDGYRARD